MSRERSQPARPHLTIRRGMDVYDADQSAYIGSVIGVIPASAADQKDDAIRAIIVRPGRHSPLARPLHIPARAVRSISMDRLILDVPKSSESELPREWHERVV